MGLSDHAHAIYSVTTKALVKELNALSEATLRERFNARMLKTYNLQDFYKYNIGQAWTFPEYLDNTFSELMSYYSVFKTVAAGVAKEDKGLVFYRYEDW